MIMVQALSPDQLRAVFEQTLSPRAEIREAGKIQRLPEDLKYVMIS
jgi:hypothetical protein